MRKFILNYKDSFSLAQLVYDWPKKPVFEGVIAQVLAELVAEGLVKEIGLGFGGHLFYEVVK